MLVRLKFGSLYVAGFRVPSTSTAAAGSKPSSSLGWLELRVAPYAREMLRVEGFGFQCKACGGYSIRTAIAVMVRGGFGRASLI